jgi:aminomethyltransferase
MSDEYKDTPIMPFMEAEATNMAMEGWHGFKSPAVYTDQFEEASQLRKATGIIDVTPMRKARITGSDARTFINHFVTRDISKLQAGRVAYVIWTNEAGKTIDDGTLYCFGDNDFRLCSGLCQMEYLKKISSGKNVMIKDESNDVAALAFSGATAYASLIAAGASTQVAELKPFQFLSTKLGGADVMISRTGFTGDLAYEAWFANADAAKVWEGIKTARGKTDIKCVGMGALLDVRAEAGFIIPGLDCAPADTDNADFERSPIELGVEWLITWDKPSFIGKDALVKEKAAGSAHKLVGVKIEGDDLAMGGSLTDASGNDVGVVTWPAKTAHVQGQFGLAMVTTAASKEGTQLNVTFSVDDKEVKTKATVVKLPFYTTDRARQTPPQGA